MATQTLRPNATVETAGSPSIGGGSGSHHAATSDNSDSTYTQLNASAGVLNAVRYGFDSYTIPANAQIRSFTPRVRHDNLSAGSVRSLQLSIGGNDFATEQLSAHGGAFATQTASARTATPTGVELSQSSIDAIELVMRNHQPAVGAAGNNVKIAELYVDLVYNESPVATGASLGTVVTARPAITWTYSDPEGDAQERYRVKVFSAAQYGAVGFDPNTSIPVVDSGQKLGNATSWTCTVDLVNGVTYRAFIYVADSGSGGRYSLATAAGPYTSFTVGIVPLAVPEVSVVADDSNSRHTLNLRDRQNLLTANVATAEVAVGSWTHSLCSTARSTLVAYSGTASTEVTTTTAGTNHISAPTGTRAPVTVGQKYSASAFVRAGSTSRQVVIAIDWYDASNAIISSSASSSHADSSSAWRMYSVTGTAPALAVSAVVKIQFVSTALSEKHYVDAVSFVPYAVNLIDNPIFESDSDADGVADSWNSYSFGSGSAVPAIQSDPENVFAGIASQGISWASNGAFKGAYQNLTDVVLVAGMTYTLSAWVKLTSAGNVNLLADTGTQYQSTTAVAAGEWTRVSLTFTPAASSTTAVVYVRSDYAGVNTLFIGQTQLEHGSSATSESNNRYLHVPGGILTAQRFEVERSSDGGESWILMDRLYEPSLGIIDVSTVDVSDALQSFIAHDYEAERGVEVLYRVRSKALVSGNTITSQWSTWIEATPLAVTGWILKSLTDPSANIRLHVHSDVLEWTSEERQSAVNAIGRSKPIIMSDVVGGESAPVELSFLDDDSYDAFVALRQRREAMLLQSSYGDHRYVKFGAQVAAGHPLNGGGTRKRIVKTSFIEVDA